MLNLSSYKELGLEYQAAAEDAYLPITPSATNCVLDHDLLVMPARSASRYCFPSSSTRACTP